MHRTLRIMPSVLACALLVSACGSTTASSPDGAATDTGAATEADATTAPEATTAASDSTADTAGPVDGETAPILAGIEAAQWADNITITIGDDTFRFQSDGLPNHELPDQYAVPSDPNVRPDDEEERLAGFIAQDTSDIMGNGDPIDVEIPLNPVYSETVTETDLGQIGVVISGARLFNDYEDAERTEVAVDNNFDVGGAYFLDPCNGHTGTYHYHGIPYCITDAVDNDGQHSTIIGFVLDGFPFYGNKNADGTEMVNADLDECGGHFGATPEFPDGIYHYHLTDDAAPYSFDCYHGVIDTSQLQGPPGGDRDGEAGDPGGQAPDFTDAAAALGVSTEELEAALGAPPFDLAAAAQTLGVSEDDLRAVLPTPPGQ